MTPSRARPWASAPASSSAPPAGSRTTSPPARPLYWALSFVLVFAFTFFYTLVTFQQQNLSENLQKQGGFVPGIRPGRPTQQYINKVLVRITFAGALFLGFIAIVPFLATEFIPDSQALTISSTGLLIVVGVALDSDEASRSATPHAQL